MDIKNINNGELLKDWFKDHPKMKECLKGYDIDNVIVFGGKFDENRGSSFFYNEEVFNFEYKNRQLSLRACGEIRIFKNGELVFDVKERNEGFGFEVKTDKDLKKVDEHNGFNWENNNWFECEFKTKEDECYDFIMGDVFFDMEEAFSNIIIWLKDDEWWAK